jgi:hypothetical protein
VWVWVWVWVWLSAWDDNALRPPEDDKIRCID